MHINVMLECAFKNLLHLKVTVFSSLGNGHSSYNTPRQPRSQGPPRGGQYNINQNMAFTGFYFCFSFSGNGHNSYNTPRQPRPQGPPRGGQYNNQNRGPPRGPQGQGQRMQGQGQDQMRNQRR